MTDTTQLQALAKRVPDRYISQRTTGGGFKADYVGHADIQQMLLAKLGPCSQKIIELIFSPEGVVEGVVLEMMFLIDGMAHVVQEIGECGRVRRGQAMRDACRVGPRALVAGQLRVGQGACAIDKGEGMIRVGSLSTGIAGLELALTYAGVDHSLEYVSDNDPDICKWLEAKRPDIPNLGDFTKLDELPQVDLLTAGFPCQPVSTAGGRAGLDDERWLFDDIADLVGRMETRPDLFLENVPGLLTANGGHAMARVVHRLAALGYIFEWTTLAASDIGAPHRRLRWWGYATAADASRLGRSARPGSGEGGSARVGGHGSRHDGRTATADADSPSGKARIDAGPGGERPRLQSLGFTDLASYPFGVDPERRGGPGAMAGSLRQERYEIGRGYAGGDAFGGGGEADADSDRVGREGRESGPSGDPGRRTRDRSFGRYAEAVERWEPVMGPAPSPVIDGKLNHVFVEWMMGYPTPWVSDVLSRSKSLKALGNSVVPQCAAAAGEDR